MPLASGTKLGPYEILAPLGSGGMGEVYRARDTKLGRDVALKVLPAAFAGDAQRMARSQREAQVLASLNHPNIAAIYGLEESGNIRALVMELVEGQTLSDSAGGRHGMPLNDALNFAKQIAEALEAAHEKGIIHRDLKPANIKITPQGTVKVLDFGLAKALDPQDSGVDPSNSPTLSPTLSVAATQAGMILGTAAYMSPEQARGKSVDRRADIWSFGCILYELLAGQKPFEGESVSDTLAAVIKDTPDLNKLPAETPAPIRKLLLSCLNKDPKHRLQAIGDARISIEEYLANPIAGEVAAAPNDAKQPRRGYRFFATLAVAGLMLVIGLAVGWGLKSERSDLTQIWSGQMLGGPSVAFGGRISPDGRTLAFQAMVDGLTQVGVMDTESGDWTVLTKDRTRGYITELNWSPDGTSIYFDREYSVPRGIYAVSRFGGEERLVLEDAMGPEVLPDGSLLVVRVNQDRYFQMYHFWPESGRTLALSGIISASNTDLCPPVRPFRDGNEAVFFGQVLDDMKSDASAHLYAIDLTSGKTRRLAPGLNLIPSAIKFFPLTVTSDDQSVIVDSREGDLHHIVAVPRNGSGHVRTLMSLTAPPWFMDIGKDGTLYLDQTARELEILKFSPTGGTPEILAGSETPLTGVQSTFQLADGRVLIDNVVAGKSRLLLAKPGSNPIPFIATKEETSGPVSRVGESEIAFLLGPTDSSELAIASIADGRIVRRLKGPQSRTIADFVASHDGSTIYYVAARTIWAVPTTDGQPRRIGPGDAVSEDPNGKDLIVQLREKDGVRLVRVPVSGGTEEPIPIRSTLRLAPIYLGSHAIGKNERALMAIATPDNWFYSAGILDLHTGILDRIPLNSIGDLMGMSWQPDGKILSTLWPIKGKLWRFRPVGPENKR